MLTIRLSRVGKRKMPIYRFVIMDSKKDPWAKSIEILGTRDPRTKEVILKTDRVKYWLSQGATPSDTVWNIFVDQKLVEGKKHNVTHLTAARQKTLAEEKAKNETPAA